MPSAVDAVELEKSSPDERLENLWNALAEEIKKRDEEDKKKKEPIPVDPRIVELTKPLFEGVNHIHEVITKTGPRHEYAQVNRIKATGRKVEALSRGTQACSHLTKAASAILAKMDKEKLEKIKIDQELKEFIDAIDIAELEKVLDKKDLAQVKKLLGTLDLSLGAEISRDNLKKLDNAVSTLVDTLKTKTNITITTELQKQIHNLQAFQEVLKNIAKRHDDLMRTIIGNSGGR